MWKEGKRTVAMDAASENFESDMQVAESNGLMDMVKYVLCMQKGTDASCEQLENEIHNTWVPDLLRYILCMDKAKKHEPETYLPWV